MLWNINPNLAWGYALMTENKSTGQLVDRTDIPSMVMTTETDQPGIIQIAVMNPDIGKIAGPFRYNDINDRQTWHAKPTIQPVTLTLIGQWDLVSGDGVSILSTDENSTQIRFDCIDGQSIGATLKTDAIALEAETNPQSINICEEDSVEITTQLSGIEENATVNFNLINPPSDIELSSEKSTDEAFNQQYRLILSQLNNLDLGKHDIEFAIKSGDRSIIQKISITKAQKISAPKLMSPNNGSEGIESPINLKWEASNGANEYIVEISDSQSFSPLIINQKTSETNFSTKNLNDDTQYYWRVKANRSRKLS